MHSRSRADHGLRGFFFRAIPGKVLSGFPSGIAGKQSDRAVPRFREKLNRSRTFNKAGSKAGAR
ncbi:hypothetical protein FP026_22600 [Rhizobium tropici]|uniref:Uncharacterized protein n=1 Tax=Rhizobium tropici TaxID=398 RepID=A0A5B0VV19_RHITR|nr:hypothetical protein FP026_22600 [Rhizobium tropici]